MSVFMKTVLVIDDEAPLRMMIRAVMESAEWQVLEAESGQEAVRLLAEHPEVIDVALLDMRMPGMDGHATLARLHEIKPLLPVVMLTAFGTVGSAVDAMKRGAFDYITKPADNEELITVLEKGYQYSRLLSENDKLRQELNGGLPINDLVGNSPAMRKLQEFIAQAAPSEATVLIMGESGTGKELVAEALHMGSARADKALVKVNCAALPGQLLESELFGYEKGAFTGAVKDKPGRFLLARGGTIFLDEIGELPLEIQAKLLRVLQERVVEPLGSVKPIPVDVRVLCATNRNLRQEVQDGKFREDLYFRLNVLEMVLPPLRERLDDLPLLINRLLEKLCRKNHKEVHKVAREFLEALARYSWPGNVRELENVLERALILNRSDTLSPDSLPPQIIHAWSSPASSATAPGAGGPLNGNNAFNPASMTAGIPPAGQHVQPGLMPSFSGAGGENSRIYAPKAGTYPGANAYAAPNGFSGGNTFSGQGGGTENDVNAPSYSGGGYSQQGTMPADQVPGSGAGLPPGVHMPKNLSPLEEAEFLALVQALQDNHGHRERTANSLGVSRRTLQYKLKKFGLIRHCST